MFPTLFLFFLLYTRIESRISTAVNISHRVPFSRLPVLDLYLASHRKRLKRSKLVYQWRTAKKCDRSRDERAISLIIKDMLHLCRVFLIRFHFQGFKVFFFTVGGFYIAYLLLLILKAYSELRSMPYFGKYTRLSFDKNAVCHTVCNCILFFFFFYYVLYK